MKRDDNFSTLAMVKAVTLVLETQADTLAAIGKELDSFQSDKDAKAAIEPDNSQLWANVRALAESVDAATIDAENVKLTRAVFSAVLSDVAKSDTAAKTLASYASTGGKLIEAVRAGRLAWITLPEQYKEVREAMKPDHKKELEARSKEISKALKAIRGHKLPEEAKKALAAILEQAKRYETEAVNSKEKSKKKAEAARELEEIRQQHPTEPATVEVSKAAANG